MSEHAFVPELQLNCLKEIFQAVRSGDPAQYLDAAQHGCWFTGCLIEMKKKRSEDDDDKLDDDINIVFGLQRPEEIPEEQFLCDKLERLMPELADKGPATKFGAIPWLALVKLLPEFIRLIQILTEKAEDAPPEVQGV